MQAITREQFASRFGLRAVFGMVHMRPLPGAPGYVRMGEALDAARADAEALVAGGASGIVFENFGDRPFFKSVGAETVAAMTRVVIEATGGIDLPFGINVLRNDGEAALAIAAATGASFVRINVLVGAMVTDQGLIEGEAAKLMRLRRRLCPDVMVFADHLVKHAVPLAPFDEDQLAKDLRLRAFADAVVVSGMETGAAADPSRFERLRKVIDAPLVVGSGLTEANAGQYSAMADAAIVGTSVKENGDVDSPVDAESVRRVVRAFRK